MGFSVLIELGKHIVANAIPGVTFIMLHTHITGFHDFALAVNPILITLGHIHSTKIAITIHFSLTSIFELKFQIPLLQFQGVVIIQE